MSEPKRQHDYTALWWLVLIPLAVWMCSPRTPHISGYANKCLNDETNRFLAERPGDYDEPLSDDDNATIASICTQREAEARHAGTD